MAEPTDSRTAEEIEAELREILGGTEEEHAEWRRLRQAQEDASRCGKCRVAISPKDPVWIAPFVRRSEFGGCGTWLVPCCQACGAKPSWRRIHYYASPFQCVACGRDVYLRVTRGRQHRGFIMHAVACSEKCRTAHYKANRPKRPRPVLTLTCPVCGKKFEAARENARTCGSVCRQKDYRRRVTGGNVRLNGHLPALQVDYPPLVSDSPPVTR